jgi:hypothetical protein
MQKNNGNVKTINKTKPASYTAIQEKKMQSGFNSLNGENKISKPEGQKKSSASTKTSIPTISLSKSVQNIPGLKNNLKNSESSNNIQEYKFHPYQSTKEIRTINNNNSMKFTRSGMIRVNSLKPFPKIDPEFYSDNQNYFWNKELQRTNTERNILAKSMSGKFLEKNFTTFQKVCYLLFCY